MKKMFVPVKEEKEIISLRISMNLVKELDKKAIEYGISRNELIIQSISYALENSESEKNE